MKKNIILFVISLVLIACSKIVSIQKSKYPYDLGTWRINSLTHATWIGNKNIPAVAFSTSSQNGSDTLIINSPNQRGLTLTSTQTRDQFELTLIDSTLTWADFDSTYGLSIEKMVPWSANNVIDLQGGIHKESPERIVMQFTGNYNATNDIGGNEVAETFIVTIMKQDSTVLKTYKFITTGMKNAIKLIAVH